MPEPDRQVTIRRLPDGEPQPAAGHSLTGALLRVELPPTPANRQFGIGALVEVESADVLYLGEVQGCQGPLLLIAVEHAVDRGTLAAIQQVWQPPQDQ
ncbi:MAG: hypothetical protein ABSF98_28280 [Bryobacteraceae bacterium]|jgi:hypothetical protein